MKAVEIIRSSLEDLDKVRRPSTPDHRGRSRVYLPPG